METRWIMIIVGVIVILLGASGLSGKQRKNQWLVNLMGDAGFRIFNIILGIVFIVLAFILF